MLEYAKSDIHRRVGRPKGPGRAVKGAVASEVVLSGFVFYIKSNLGNRWIPDQGTEAHHLPWHRSTFPGQSLHIFAVTSRQQLPKSSSNSHVNVVAIILSATHNHSPTWGFVPVSAYQPSTGCKNSALYFSGAFAADGEPSNAFGANEQKPQEASKVQVSCHQVKTRSSCAHCLPDTATQILVPLEEVLRTGTW